MARGMLAAVVAIAAIVFAAAAVAAAPPAALLPLPNLVQEPPSGLVFRRVSGRWHLAFTSTVDNLGSAPLVVVATRASRRVATMNAFQVANGRRLGHVGTLGYAIDPTHQHWHLLPFELYELRRAADGALVGAARKTGFCLADSRRLWPGAPSAHRTRCGPNRPAALQITEGISAGWADIYAPEREGQFVDVSALPAGRYALVNRVNSGRAIQESSYADNVAATLFDLSWPSGPQASPAISVVSVCLGAIQCDAAGIR